MKTGGIFAVILLFVGPPAFAGSVNGNGALALAALIADRSPSLTRAERVLLSAYLDGRPKMDFPRSKKIILRENALVCRIGSVDITAKNCNLTFGGQTISLVGRQAQALYATLVEIGVASPGSAGSIVAEAKDLECTIDPAEVSQKNGGGASCKFAGNL